jgi:hypothetical protein
VQLHAAHLAVMRGRARGHFVDIEISAPDLDKASFNHPSLPSGTVASTAEAGRLHRFTTPSCRPDRLAVQFGRVPMVGRRKAIKCEIPHTVARMVNLQYSFDAIPHASNKGDRA